MLQKITEATAEGTLYSRDWDTEPLFPLPDIGTVNNECVSPLSFVSVSCYFENLLSLEIYYVCCCFICIPFVATFCS